MGPWVAHPSAAATRMGKTERSLSMCCRAFSGGAHEAEGPYGSDGRPCARRIARQAVPPVVRPEGFVPGEPATPASPSDLVSRRVGTEAAGMGGIEGGSQGRVSAVRKVLEAMAEAWRERISERRARAAPKLGSDPRVQRSRLGAALEARLAVRSGVRLDDYLRHRLAKYATRLPLPLEALPVTVDIEGGEAVVRPRPPPRQSPANPRAEVPVHARALVARDGLYAARELRDAEVALDQLDARAAAARVRLEAVELQISGALAAGKIVARPDVDATPEQLGRPPVPSPAPILALRAFVAVLLAAEGWRFSAPVLAASGLAPDGIEETLRSSPVPAGLALAFALGAAV